MHIVRHSKSLKDGVEYPEQRLSPSQTSKKLGLLVAIAGIFSACTLHALSATATTKLQLSPGATVGTGVQVTLSASVTNATGPVKTGFVTFCDVSATRYCEDLAVLGSVAVNGSGVATLKKVLLPGEHKIFAIYGPINGVVSPGSSVQTIDIPVQVKAVPTIVLNTDGGFTYPVDAQISVPGRNPISGTVSIVQTQNKQALTTVGVQSNQYTTNFSLSVYNAVAVSGLPTAASSSVVGDFNGDGLPDLAVSASAGIGDGTESLLGVSLNDVTHPGQLLPPTFYEGTLSGYNLVSADLNGDGVLDLLEYNGSSSLLLPGDPAHPGHFGTAITIPSTNGFQVAADLNQDGLPDLIGFAAGGIDIFYSTPSAPGQFRNETVIPGGKASVAAVDVNGDGLLDLVSVSSDPAHPGVAVFLGDPAHLGQFLAPTVYPVDTGYVPSQILVGDFDMDGHPDLAVVTQRANGKALLRILLNNAASPGQYRLGFGYYLPTPSSTLVLGEFNGDGLLDLATPSADGQAVAIYSGVLNGQGTFYNEYDYPISTPIGPHNDPETLQSLNVADFDADGISDLSSILQADAPLTYYPLGVLLTKATWSTGAFFEHVTADPTASPLVQALYSGNDYYASIGSCDIDLKSYPVKPVLYDIHADVSDVGATVLWYWKGDVGAIDYGLTPALGSTTGFQRAPPSHLGGPSYIRLSGLTPNTKYYYHVRAIGYFSGCSHWTTTSPVESFTTAP